MTKTDAINYFGGVAKLAKAIDRTPQAISQWGEKIPDGMDYKIQVVTGGKLKVDRSANLVAS